MSKRLQTMRVLAAAAALITAGASVAVAQATKPITVYIVRHAEKAAAPAADPPLTPAGQARARVLADTARAEHVSVIITTQFRRTKETAAPSARRREIKPEVIPATGPQHIQDVVAAIRKHGGQTVLVVEHSNTVPEIIAALGAPQPPAICDAEYDNMYVVRIAADGKATVQREHYGARTPVPANCGAMK